jgi:hypothetical protein
MLDAGVMNNLWRKSLVLAVALLLLSGCEYFRPGPSPLRSSDESAPVPSAWAGLIQAPITGGFTP